MKALKQLEPSMKEQKDTSARKIEYKTKNGDGK